MKAGPIEVKADGSWWINGKRVGPHESIVLDACCLLACGDGLAKHYLGLSLLTLLGREYEEEWSAVASIARYVRDNWEWVKGA